MTMQISGLKPGQAAPVAGLFQQIGPRGGKGFRRMVDKGDPLPPNGRPGSTYTLVDQAQGLGNITPAEYEPKLDLLTKKGQLLPGVEIDCRAKLYDLMDELD